MYLEVLVDEEGVVVAVLLGNKLMPFYQTDVDRQRVDEVEHLYVRDKPKLVWHGIC